MPDFKELCFIKTMRNVIYCLKVRVITNISTKFFRLLLFFSIALKYQKQSPGGVLQKGALKRFTKFIEKYKNYP